MAKDILRYDLMVQEALKGVVRKVLSDAAREGLPGEHHFYVSFRTGAPGVRISQRLREKYPDEMTIVLQHQFWDLQVHDHTFEVGLSFSGIPERLLVPYEALSGFFDPSVEFGLKFENLAEAPAPSIEPAKPAPPMLTSVPTPRGAGSEPQTVEPRKPAAEKKPAAERKPAEKLPVPARNGKPPAAEDKAEAEDGAKVLSLDAFRKKT
jgi:hypothetical protein